MCLKITEKKKKLKERVPEIKFDFYNNIQDIQFLYIQEMNALITSVVYL